MSEQEFSLLPYSSKNAVRYSVDGSKVCINLVDQTPSFAGGKTIYTHTEILPIMNNSDWSPAVDTENTVLFDDESLYT